MDSTDTDTDSVDVTGLADSLDSADSVDSTDSVDLADSAYTADSDFNPHLDSLGFFNMRIIIIVIIDSLFSFNREVTVKISI